MSKPALGLASLGLALVSCSVLEQPLEGEPWEEFRAGEVVVGATSGWAFYQAKAKAAGKSGVLTGDSGSDTTDLVPNWGGAAKLHYLVTDNFAMGAIVEVRSFNPDSLKPLSAELSTGDFETLHLIAGGRYYFDPFEEGGRWRPYLGLDFSWVPDVKLGDVTVDYPESTGIPDETVNVTGSDYWTIIGIAGFNYQASDHMLIEMGAFYDYALTTSDATVAFQNLGGAEAEMALRPQGLVIYLGVAYSF